MRLRALVALGLTSLASVGLTLFMVGAPANAAAPLSYPVKTCSHLGVSTENPRPGQSITVAGDGFIANARVHLVLTNTKPGSAVTSKTKVFDLGTVKANSSGSFSVRIKLPSAVTNKGHYYIEATSGAVSLKGCPPDPYQTLTFQTAGISASPTNGTSTTAAPANNNTTPAITGLDVAGLIAIGLVLVGAGVFFTRRGRRAHA